jgi:hypothetical protein
MAATNYVVTVQRPTEVTALATGYFTSPTEFNLIVAKNTHFEIYIIASEGLKLVKDVCIYGQINVLKCFRLSVIEKSSLFSIYFLIVCFSLLKIEYEERCFIYFYDKMSWHDIRLSKNRS